MLRKGFRCPICFSWSGKSNFKFTDKLNKHIGHSQGTRKREMCSPHFPPNVVTYSPRTLLRYPPPGSRILVCRRLDNPVGPECQYESVPTSRGWSDARLTISSCFTRVNPLNNGRDVAMYVSTFPSRAFLRERWCAHQIVSRLRLLIELLY